MGKFHKVGGAKQSVQAQKNLHSVHKTIHKNKKQKSISKNKNVASILQNGKSKVKEVAGMLSAVVEERPLKLGKKMKKKGKHGNVVAPQQTSPSPKAKKPLQKDTTNGGKHLHIQVQLENGSGKQKRDSKNKLKKKKQKQTVRKNYVLLRQPTSSEDEDEDDDEDEDEESAVDNESSIKLQHLDATLGSSTDSDDDEFNPQEESDAEMSDAHSGDSVVSDDIADLSGDDSTEEQVLQDGGDESDSDEDDDDEDEESEQLNKNESLKVQHLNATLPSSDDEDEEYIPDEDEVKLKSAKKKKNKDESLNLTALQNTINSSDEDDDDYVPDKSVDDVEDGFSVADSDEDESEEEEHDESITTKKAAKRKAKEEEDSDDDSELDNTIAVEGQADDTKEIKEYLASLKPFNEEDFRGVVCTENVKKIVEALVKQVKEEMGKKKGIFADYRYILQVTSFKIPKCPRRMAKLRLTHSLITEDDDVCFIVRDLERGRKVDYEETVHHYEDLFAEKGIKGIKAIMPFNQIRNEYKTYESKIKLSNLYDYYLCDGAIVGHVVGFLGKHFQKPRSTLYAVRMDNKDLAAEVKKALYKTSYKQSNKGPTIAIPVGHCNMNYEQITENVMTVVDQLKDIYPGGLENIRNMNVKINLTGTSALPIYISFCRPPVSAPNVIGPKEKHLKEVKKKTNEILQKFSMTQTGELVKLDAEQVLKRKKEIKAATKAKKAKLEEGDKKSPAKTDDKSPSKGEKTKSDQEDAVKDEKEANKSLNVSKKGKPNKDKSLNVSKKEKTPDAASPKKGSTDNEKSKKKKIFEEVEFDEKSDEEDSDEQEVEDDDDDDDSDEQGGNDNEDDEEGGDDDDDDDDDGDDDDDDDDEDEDEDEE